MRISLPIDKYLRPEYRFNQTDTVARLHYKEAEVGICMSLALQWMANCHKPGADSELEFQKIQNEGFSYFKQMFGNQRALLNWRGQTKIDPKSGAQHQLYANALELISEGNLTAPHGFSFMWSENSQMMAATVQDTALASPLKSCIVLLFQPSGSDYNVIGDHHTIVAIEESGEYTSSVWRIFDPNEGLFICDVARDGHTLYDFFDELWRLYGRFGHPIIAGRCLPVSSKKA
jgi:hypothetical protein